MPIVTCIWCSTNRPLSATFFFSENHKFVINPHDPFAKNQQWTLKAGTIRNRHNLKFVLQMAVTEDGTCELVGATFNEDDESQIWDLEHV